MEIKNLPVFVNIQEISEFQVGSVIKKVPIVTNQIMASVMFFDSQESVIKLKDFNADRIYHIISGLGKIIIEKEETLIREDFLILVPKEKAHFFSIKSKHMTVLCVKSVRSHIDILKDKEVI